MLNRTKEGGEYSLLSLSAKRDAPVCSSSNESGFKQVDKLASLSPQPNVVALRSRTGAITVDAREQESNRPSMPQIFRRAQASGHSFLI